MCPVKMRFIATGEKVATPASELEDKVSVQVHTFKGIL